MTESAERRAGERPEPASTVATRRSRWIAAECSRSARGPDGSGGASGESCVIPTPRASMVEGLDDRSKDTAMDVLGALYQGQRDLARRLADEADGLTLAEAAALDEVDRVRELLDEGAGADARTLDGFTPLHLAAFF